MVYAHELDEKFKWFVDARFGMFIHWGIMAATGRGCLIQEQEKIHPDEYERKYCKHFDPDLFDPEDWARRASQAGMQYVTIVAKHHDGFCLWPSKANDYNVTKTPYGKDLLGPMVEAFRAERLKIGLYHSLIDWHDPDFTIDKKHPLRDDEEARAKNPERDMDRFRKKLQGELTELLTWFGHVDIVWFDWSYPGPDGKGREDWDSEALYKIVQQHQPHAIINDRYDYPEGSDTFTPEQWQPTEPIVDEAGNEKIWEANQTFSGTLAWSYAREDAEWKSVDLIIRMLIESVANGGNMLMNVGPTARGEFEPEACKYLERIGEWMRRHGRSIYGCGQAPESIVAPKNCFLTYNSRTNRLYLHIAAWPHKHIYLHGLSGGVEYAHFLHDASEVFTASRPAKGVVMNEQFTAETNPQDITLTLPSKRPDVEVAVIEVFLNGEISQEY